MYNIPIIASETGCNLIRPRKFDDVRLLLFLLLLPFQLPVILSEKMNNIFAGFIVYEFTEEANHYGLVKNPGQKKLADYESLKQQMSKLPTSSLVESQYTAKEEYSPTCPVISDDWVGSSGSVLLFCHSWSKYADRAPANTK
jgi:hypothetical protein